VADHLAASALKLGEALGLNSIANRKQGQRHTKIPPPEEGQTLGLYKGGCYRHLVCLVCSYGIYTLLEGIHLKQSCIHSTM